MGRIPLVRTVYTGVKQVTQTLFAPGGQSFRKVLLVEYPCAGVWSIAFQTGEVSHEIEALTKVRPDGELFYSNYAQSYVRVFNDGPQK